VHILGGAHERDGEDVGWIEQGKGQVSDLRVGDKGGVVVWLCSWGM
jgi:hypothetical protein